jgi:hypothetical protein
MADVAYSSWSLIHRDLEPTQQQPVLTQPPMLTTIALDPTGSLQFELVSAPEALTIRLVVTGMSIEGAGDDFLLVYRGAPGSYKPVQSTWVKGQDGPDAVLSTAISWIGDHLKLHQTHGRPVIVTTISFSTE